MTTKRATAPARPKMAGSVLELVGGTPLVRLNRIPKPGGAIVLAKLESLNPGGSVKDRIALAMVEDAERRGVLKAAGQLGWLDEDRAVLEALTGIRRAGADIIITYFAKDAARLIEQGRA